MKKKDLVVYDAHGHFEVQDGALRELADAETTLVSAGQAQANTICRENLVCANGGCLTVNGRCSDGDGRNEFLTHGNHTLNGVC